MLENWKYRKIIISFFSLVILYGLSWYADRLELFDEFIWMSPVFHLSGGFLVAYFVLVLYKTFRDKRATIEPKTLLFIFIIATTTLIGVFWEFYEYLIDHFLTTDYQTTIEDTLLDLFMDIAGSILFCLFYFAKSRLKLTESSK